MTSHPRRKSSRAFALAAWAIGFVILGTMIGVVAHEFGMIADNEHRTIDDLVGQWKTVDLNVGEIVPLSDKAGAARAVMIDINGGQVEVYHYDVSDPEQLKRMEAIRASHTIETRGEKVPAEVNGAFVMTMVGDHPAKDRILHTFKGFGTFEGIKKEDELDLPK
jgi:hypothetical protein